LCEEARPLSTQQIIRYIKKAIDHKTLILLKKGTRHIPNSYQVVTPSKHVTAKIFGLSDGETQHYNTNSSKTVPKLVTSKHTERGETSHIKEEPIKNIEREREVLVNSKEVVTARDNEKTVDLEIEETQRVKRLETRILVAIGELEEIHDTSIVKREEIEKHMGLAPKAFERYIPGMLGRSLFEPRDNHFQRLGGSTWN
jgi:hypothetical protein